MEENISMNTKEKKQLYLQCMNDVARADGEIDRSELDILNFLSKALSVEVPKERIFVELNNQEKYFLLREMYRIAIAGDNFDDDEKDVIDNYVKEYEIDSDVNDATKNWASKILEAENQYNDFIKNK